MAENSAFQEELEVLLAIYLEDLVLIKTTDTFIELKITLHPSTADDEEKKYVCLTLHFIIPDTYPNKVPQISIKSPRGLSDAHLASIDENLNGLASSKVGESMVFELIEYAKESLTDNNHPSCVCPICLDYFTESEKFFRTDCYHFFHLVCIKEYIDLSSETICPVCRTSFEINQSLIQSIEVSNRDSIEVEFVPDQKYIAWQKKCKRLYEKQKKKGGIIDIEFEKNKYLITMNDNTIFPSNTFDIASEKAGNVECIVGNMDQANIMPNDHRQKKYSSKSPSGYVQKHSGGEHNANDASKNNKTVDNSTTKHYNPMKGFNDKNVSERRHIKNNESTKTRDVPLTQRNVHRDSSDNSHHRHRNNKDSQKFDKSAVKHYSTSHERRREHTNMKTVKKKADEAVDSLPKNLKEERPTKSVKMKTEIIHSERTQPSTMTQMVTTKLTKPPPGFHQHAMKEQPGLTALRAPPGFHFKQGVNDKSIKHINETEKQKPPPGF